MPRMVICAKFGRELPGLDAPPFPGPEGQKIYDEISALAWQMWGRQSVVLITNQYKAGTVSYLDVVVAQAAALSNERTAVDIQGRRITASVLLVKALGGGWMASDLPSNDDLASDKDLSKRADAAQVPAANAKPQ